MRLDAALHGDLRKMMAEEYARTEVAVTRAVGAAGEGLKGAWRENVASAGLGRRLSNTIRKDLYPSSGVSAGAAAYVYTKSPKIIRAHQEGVTIRSAKGAWLAIPLPAAGRGAGGRRMTPGEWERRNGAKLRFIYRRGRPGLLVADTFRLGSAGTARASRSKTGRGAQTVPIFVLVPQVRLKKVLDLERLAAFWSGNYVVEALDREFAALDAAAS